MSTTSAADLPLVVLVDRNAAAVVDDGHRAVDVNRDVDLVAEAGQRLVDRVVDDLADEVMQPGRSGRADDIAGRLRTASRPSRTLILSR